MRGMCWAAVAALVLTYAGQAQDGKTEEGFTSLFNGKDLTGWHIENKGKFSVKGGMIFLDKGRGWLRSDKEYQDFELRLDFRCLNEKADSGIFIRASKEGKDWPAKNYQVQTIDADSMGNIFTAGLSKAKVKRDTTKTKRVRKKLGEWQSLAITAQGDRFEVKLNGETITTGTGLAVQPGYIGLQGEGGQLEFKNLRIKETK
ncbi:MAG: DUF1080 domain-containing protein [Gemmataceae bacterium]|nr:DUF1080 domain-containing protein [Gemmataceae bacterium]